MPMESVTTAAPQASTWNMESLGGAAWVAACIDKKCIQLPGNPLSPWGPVHTMPGWGSIQ